MKKGEVGTEGHYLKDSIHLNSVGKQFNKL